MTLDIKDMQADQTDLCLYCLHICRITGKVFVR